MMTQIPFFPLIFLVNVSKFYTLSIFSRQSFALIHTFPLLRPSLTIIIPSTRRSFVFDPSGRLIYYWSMIVSMAFIYNSWVILYRFAFEEINSQTMSLWLTLDGIADFIYVTDIAVHFRIGYLEEGVLQTDGSKFRTIVTFETFNLIVLLDCSKIKAALHELDHVLHRLFMPFTT